MVDDNSNNIVVIDKQGKFLFMNGNAQKLILRLNDGTIPNNFAHIVSEQWKSKFNDSLNTSFRSVETQIFQINLSYVVKSDKMKGIKIKSDDRSQGEIIQEWFEMQMSQMRWDNKKCIMLAFHSFQRHIEENSRLQIQSQSIMDKIAILVDKIEMKYAWSKEANTEADTIENMFYKGLILSTNRIQNEFSIVNECLKIKNSLLENKREPLLLIETFINTIDLVSMDLKRGIRIEINNDVCLPTYVRVDKDKFITILSSVLEMWHTLCRSKSAIILKVRLERMDHNKKIYYISFEINFEYINNLDVKSILINNQSYLWSNENYYNPKVNSYSNTISTLLLSQNRSNQSLPTKMFNLNSIFNEVDRKLKENNYPSGILKKPKPEVKAPVIRKEKTSRVDKMMLTANKMYIHPVLSEISEENKSDHSHQKSSMEIPMIKNLERTLLDCSIIGKGGQPKEEKKGESSTGTLYNEEDGINKDEISIMTRKIGLIKTVVTELLNFLEGEIEYESTSASDKANSDIRSSPTFSGSNVKEKNDNLIMIKFKIPMEYSNETESKMNVKGEYNINQRRYKNGTNIVFDSPKYNSVNLDVDNKNNYAESKNKLKNLFENKVQMEEIKEENPSVKMLNDEETANIKVEEYKDDLQSQSGTTNLLRLDENSPVIKYTETTKSNQNRNNNITAGDDSEEESEGPSWLLSQMNETDSNVGSIREFWINTKINRDTIQSISSRFDYRIDHFKSYSETKSYKSRQNLLKSESNLNQSNGFDSKDSVSIESKPVMVPSLTHNNFISASNMKSQYFKGNYFNPVLYYLLPTINLDSKNYKEIKNSF